MSIEIKPIKKHVGATVHIDRADLTKPEIGATVLDALEERGVLVFPKINLNDEEQIAFTESLGERVMVQNSALKSGGVPGIFQVTLDPKINQHPEYVLGTFFWHMDGMPAEFPPPKATLLSARKLAPKGGQTQFASTAAAYDALPEAERAELDTLRVVHTTHHAILETFETDEEYIQSSQKTGRRERPLVWKQQNTGRKSMVIGHTADHIAGWPIAEGRALLERLMEWSAQPEFMYSHEWEAGDLAMWNNSGVLHRVIPYDRGSGRMMHRTSIGGVDTIS